MCDINPIQSYTIATWKIIYSLISHKRIHIQGRIKDCFFKRLSRPSKLSMFGDLKSSRTYSKNWLGLETEVRKYSNRILRERQWTVTRYVSPAARGVYNRLSLVPHNFAKFNDRWKWSRACAIWVPRYKWIYRRARATRSRYKCAQ